MRKRKNPLKKFIEKIIIKIYLWSIGKDVEK